MRSLEAANVVLLLLASSYIDMEGSQNYMPLQNPERVYFLRNPLIYKEDTHTRLYMIACIHT